jgi:hypothetical protein
MRRFIVLGLLLAAAACSHHNVDTDVSPADAPPVRVEVRNKYALPMEISVVGAGATLRLGTVYPGTTAQYVLPQNLVGNGSAELQARPSANSNVREMASSGPLILSPGAVVDFIIGAQIFNSTATIRP